MRNLLPHFIQEQYLRKNYEGQFSAHTLFIDISGFTNMTETLMQRGDVGAEILSAILNKIYNPILDVIYKRGGFVSTFAGDGFTVIFPQTSGSSAEVRSCLYALFSARKVQATFRRHGKQKTRFGDFQLNVKVGLSWGSVEWGIVGDESNRMYFFRGEAIDNCARSEHQAGEGDIVLDDRIWSQIVQQPILLESLTPGYYRLIKTPFDTEPIERRKPQTGSQALKELRSRRSPIRPAVVRCFIPKSVIEFKQAGEFRNAVSVFIAIQGLSTTADIDAFVALLNEQKRHFSGYFNKIDFGDKGGIALLVFGAPISYEDNVDRALGFVLAAKKGSAAHPSLKIRIGVTYGTVYAGIIGGKKRCEYTIIGDIVNLSARMAMQAEHGDIWLSENVRKHAGDRYLIEFINNLGFKGKKGKIPVYRLVNFKDAKQRLYEGEMVGRRVELKQLLDFAAPIFNSRLAGMACICGEAGMGKTRLAYAVREELTAASSVIWLDCPADQILRKPFNPFNHFLRNYFEQSSEKSPGENKAAFERIYGRLLSEIARIGLRGSVSPLSDLIAGLSRTQSVLGALLGLYWPGSLYAQLDAKGKYENTLTALKTFILSLTCFGPVVLQLDDVHWIDSDSKQFLTILARNIEKYPLFILTTMRYADDGSRPQIELPEIPTVTVDLSVLSGADVRLMAEKQLQCPITDELNELLWHRSQANPFYVQQFLHYFRENHLLKKNGGCWHLQTTRLELPTTIHSILIARIDRLTQQVKEVVKAAAVIGREFEVRVLSNMLNQEIGQDVYTAEREQIWTIVTELQCMFKHALLRDCAYQMQLESRRRELHRLAAETIARLYAENPGDKYADLALHYEKAELIDLALTNLEKAGDLAKASYKNNQALQFYDRFLKLLPLAQMNQRDRLRKHIETLLNHGQIEELIGVWDQAEKTFREALETSQQSNNKPLTAKSFGCLGQLLRQKGQHAEALECYQHQLQLSLKAGQKSDLAGAYRNLGALYLSQSNPNAAIEYLEKGLAIAEACEDKNNISKIVNDMGIVHELRGDYDSAVNAYERRLTICRELNDKRNISIITANIGVLHYSRGSFDLAMRCFQEALSLSEEIGDKMVNSFAVGNMGAILAEHGKFDEAMSCFQKKLALSEELGDQNEVAAAFLNMGHIYKDTGQLKDAMGSFEKARLLFEKINGTLFLSATYAEIGDIYMESKAFDFAAEFYDRAIEIASGLESKYFLADYFLRKAELFILTMKTDQAELQHQAGTKLAEALSNQAFLFKSKLIAAQLKFQYGDSATATQMLNEILKDLSQAADIAQTYYTLWRITGQEYDRSEALVHYQALYQEVPRYEYLKHLKELAG